MGYHNSNGRFVPTETKRIDLPLFNFCLAAGAVLAAFANAASPTPGIALDDSEAPGIRWNNHATPSAIYTRVRVPADRRPGTDLTLRMVVSKTGATAGDVTTFTVGAFCPAVGALRNADADCGGTTSAVTAGATSTTLQTVSLTIASGDLPVTPAGLTLSIKPTDGTLGTDDITIHDAWIEYEGAVSPT